MPVGSEVSDHEPKLGASLKLSPGGRGYYDFENAAKPDVEIGEVLILWFTSGF